MSTVYERLLICFLVCIFLGLSSANFSVRISNEVATSTMKFLLLLAFAVLVKTDEIKKDQGVLVLEKETFQAAITDNKHILVEFCKFWKLL